MVYRYNNTRVQYQYTTQIRDFVYLCSYYSRSVLRELLVKQDLVHKKTECGALNSCDLVVRSHSHLTGKDCEVLSYDDWYYKYVSTEMELSTGFVNCSPIYGSFQQFCVELRLLTGDLKYRTLKAQVLRFECLITCGFNNGNYIKIAFTRDFNS